MSFHDAASLANTAIRLGLLSSGQVQDGWDELGAHNAQPDDFVRVMERKGYLTPFQSSKLLKGDKDGFFLGGYRILYKVASGSFGRVYRCDDPSTGRILAIKVLRRKWSEDKHKIDLFTREGRMGMSLHHPNIVEILAVNLDRNTKQYYIVMEFVEGGNLRDLLGIRGKLQPPETLKILEETASALAYAFSRGVTHRDMKLTNILLSSQGPAKLVDFGLAGGHVGFDEKDDKTVDRTVDYAGLEKATGAPTGDPRSDIFFLGCVAYELLTGRSPLEMSRSAVTRMSAQRFQKIPPMTPADVDAPPSVFHLVETMMALDPTMRFQTPSQLFDRVREVRQEIDAKERQQARKGQRTLFLAESDERLQDLLREKLKEAGYRVLIAADPQRALDRFRQQPFDLLIVNAATVGEDGCLVFQKLLGEAVRQQFPCSGILLLGPELAEWRDRFNGRPEVSVLMQPVKFKQLLAVIHELFRGGPA
jgi:tRNA A-37 threonylcarbamoyl transferase component Bud32/CheY-like chemotaxis protein